MKRALTSIGHSISILARTILLFAVVVLLSPPAWAQQVMVTLSKGNVGDPFNGPQFLAFDKEGNLFVSDTVNHRVQRIEKQTGVVSTVVGTGGPGNTGDGGPGTSAQLGCPAGLAFGRQGHLLVADACANVIRIVAPSPMDGLIKGRSDEIITLFAGDGQSTAGPGVGPTALSLSAPTFLAVDAADSVYIGPGDSSDVSIIGIDVSNNTWVVAEYPWIDPLSLAVDKLGFVMVGGDGDDWPLLACVDPTTPSPFNQTPIVGNPNGSGFSMSSSAGIAVDSAGNLYTDLFNRNSIVKMNAPTGPCGYNGNQFTLYAGNGNQGFTGDGGAATDATLNTPTGLAFNAADNLFIADTGNNAIRAIVKGVPTPAGSSVAVNPLDQNGDSRAEVAVTFDNITTAGTTVAVTGQNAPTLPANFELAGTSLTPLPVFYDISTSAQFTGNVTVCITLNPLPAGPSLLHFNQTTQQWDNVTQSADPATGTVCGQVTSLSPFAVVKPRQQNLAPAIISANATTFQAGAYAAFSVKTTGTPTPTITAAGGLPNGVSFLNNGDGTGTMSGTPAAGAGGTYSPTFTASNATSPDAVQSFTLTVNQAPAIVSANSAAFTVGTAGSFTITATGFPNPSLVETGALPAGVTFDDNHNGTGTLSGIPNVSGSFSLSFTASNGVGVDATQSFALNVSGVSSSALSVTPSSFDFGSVARFDLASGKVTLRNTGASSVTLHKVSLTLGANADWDDFFFLNLCPGTLGAGKSCNIFVYYFADDLGTANATLNIPSSAPGSPQAVSLRGSGVRR